MEIKSRYGVTINLFLDGQGYNSDLCISCENSTDTQFKCPSAQSDVMPMECGARCFYKDGCECRKLSAHLDALKNAKSIIAKRISEIEEQMKEEC